MSRIAATRKNPKASAATRYLLTDIKAKLDSGLIENSVWYSWGRIWTPTNGPYEDPYKRVRHIRLPEDKLRHMFATAFPDEAAKTHRLLPGESRWYEHPQDKWVKKQLKIMKEKNLSEEDSWKEMLVEHRKEVHLARLQHQYQLQQVQELGGLAVSKAPLEAQLMQKRYEDAWARRETTAYEERRTEMLTMATMRLKDAEQKNEPIRKIMVDELPYNFPHDIVPSLINDNPGLRRCFDDMWFIGMSSLMHMLPFGEQQRQEYDEFCEKLDERAKAQYPRFARRAIDAWKEQVKELKIPGHPIAAIYLVEEADESFERAADGESATPFGLWKRLEDLTRDKSSGKAPEKSDFLDVAHLQEREDARTVLASMESDFDALLAAAEKKEQPAQEAKEAANDAEEEK